jgi:predicted nuclease with TOPRIM domain
MTDEAPDFISDFREIVESQVDSKTFFVCFEDCIELLKRYEEVVGQKDRWFNEHQKVLDVKNEMAAEIKLLKTKIQELEKELHQMTFEPEMGAQY